MSAMTGFTDPSIVPRTEDEWAKCLADPWWRIYSGQLYRIMTKAEDGQAGVMPFIPNAAQRRLMERLHHRNVVLKARQLGYCVDPSTRVLTADLRWVEIDSLAVGDRLVAVDEHVPGGKGASRKMRTAVVQARFEKVLKAYRITLDDGRSVVCSGAHKWLTRLEGDDRSKYVAWRTIESFTKARIKVGTQIRWITHPWGEPSFEDGWFGGMLDGEGCLSNSPNSAAGLCVSQREGHVWQRLISYAAANNYRPCIEADAAERPSKFGRVPVPKLAFGRLDEMLRLIGQTRPTRFIGQPFWEGRDLPGKRSGVGWSTVVSIDPLPPRRLVDIQTSTGTYIAEGLVSHNSTCVAILWLDHALFVPDQRCVIIAHNLDDAESMFRDKVLFAYRNLPAPLRAVMPLAKETASDLLFSHNNSAIRVATSARSGTYHRLHVSEMGKIAAKFPEKATEIVTGSFPAVPSNGCIVVESTAEGAEGQFYDLSQRAEATEQAGGPRSPADWAFHFAAWWQAPEYRLDPKGVTISPADHEYFDKVQVEMGCTITLPQRAWYVAKRDNDFGGDAPLMWREMPSTPKECWARSIEGTYYAAQLARARSEGRIGIVPPVSHVPVNTFWDIGAGDGTGIWLHQRVGAQDRFLRYIEGWGEGYAHYVRLLRETQFVFGVHYLPHDATHQRQLLDRVGAPIDFLMELAPDWRFDIVPRVEWIGHGIQMTRERFQTAWFDAEGCKEGLEHLALYRKTWNTRQACWAEEPAYPSPHREAADSLRQWAQGFDPVAVSAPTRPRRRTHGGMAI